MNLEHLKLAVFKARRRGQGTLRLRRYHRYKVWEMAYGSSPTYWSESVHNVPLAAVDEWIRRAEIAEISRVRQRILGST